MTLLTNFLLNNFQKTDYNTVQEKTANKRDNYCHIYKHLFPLFISHET